MLPPEYRDSLVAGSPQGRFMLTNFDSAVFGYPMPEWEKIEDSFRRMNQLDARVRNLQRFFIGGAVELEMDRQGRVLVPPQMRAYAGLAKDVVLAGVGHRFEIWDAARFEERRRQAEETMYDDMADLAQNGFELRL